MVKLLSRVRYLCAKNKGLGGLQKHNEREPGQRHSNKNIKPDERKTISFWNRERWPERMASGWMTVWRGQGAKAIRKDAEDGGNNIFNLGRYHQGKRRNTKIWRGNTRLKEMYGESHFLYWSIDETTLISYCDWPSRGDLSKDVIGTTKRKCIGL